MEYKDFSTIIEKGKVQESKKRIAIINAGEPHVIDAVIKAYNDGLVDPVFIGDVHTISSLLSERGADGTGTIISTETPEHAAYEAVRLVHAKEVDFLMKGHIETGPMLKVLINKTSGILSGGLVSGISIHSIPSYHKLLGVTDGAVNITPDVEKKKQILANAVHAFHALGYDYPKVAALCGVEKINPHMQETIDAAELKQWVDGGGITGCILEGPISSDIAFDKEAGVLKGYNSPVAGNPDLILMPNMVTCNIFNKSLRRFCGCTTVGILLGLSVPMVLLSRSADTYSKYTSIAVVSQMA